MCLKLHGFAVKMGDIDIELTQNSNSEEETPTSFANATPVSTDHGGSLHGYMESESTKSKEPQLMHMDEVLAKIPVGFFHYKLLLVCGLSFMADGMVGLFFIVCSFIMH